MGQDTSVFAGNSTCERTCPLGVLTARLLQAMMPATYFVHTLSGDNNAGMAMLIKKMALSIDRHEFLYTSRQQDVLLRPVQHSEHSTSLGKHFALPRLFLANFDFLEVLHSSWPVFEALDALGRHLHSRVEPLDEKFVQKGGSSLCGVRAGLTSARAALHAALPCGLFNITRAHLLDAIELALDGRTGLVHKAESAGGFELHVTFVEDVLKAAALEHGLYWLLFHAGAERPTIWRHLADLGHKMRRSTWSQTSVPIFR